MVSITFIDSQNLSQTVEVSPGVTVMQGALDHSIEGVVGECGGSCSCGTCHCYIDAAWQAKMEPITDTEKMTLECAIDIRPTSRLSCQLKVTPELDGLVVHLPASQI